MDVPKKAQAAMPLSLKMEVEQISRFRFPRLRRSLVKSIHDRDHRTLHQGYEAIEPKERYFESCKLFQSSFYTTTIKQFPNQNTF